MTTDTDHPLDNVIWNALTTQHAALAQGNALARRYPSAFTPFAALPEPLAPSLAGFHALAQGMAVDQVVAMFTRQAIAPTHEFEVVLRRDMVQMVQTGAVHSVDSGGTKLVSLGPDDAADMFALADRTKPGPFSRRTHELGHFFGVRVNGALVAMTGERVRLDGWTEISGVCVDDAFRGRGFARALILAVVERIVARGESPFLHALADNVSAIGLYRTLGFQVRVPLRLTTMRKLADTTPSPAQNDPDR